MILTRQVIALVFLLITFTVTYQLDEVDQKRIKDGLAAAAQIMKFLVEKDFISKITSVAKVCGPVFQIAALIIDIIFAFIDIESPEMKLMKEEFGNLQRRLDKFDQEFENVKKQIDWSAIHITYARYEQAIRSMSEELDTMTTLPQDKLPEFKANYIRKYENDFDGSPNKLVSSIINSERVFSVNLVQAARQYTDNHQYAVQDYMMGLLQLIIMGMQVEATYTDMRYNSLAYSEYMRKYWENKMQVLQSWMENTDKEIQNMWYEQMFVDVEKFALERPQMSNEEIVVPLYSYLNDKYRWRDFFVVAYAPLEGYHIHAMMSCETKSQFRVGNRNIIVSSYMKGTSKYNDNTVEEEKADIRSRRHRKYRGESLAWEILKDFGMTDCSKHQLIGVIGSGNNVWYIGDVKHVAWENICVLYCNDPACWFPQERCFNIFKFG